MSMRRQSGGSIVQNAILISDQAHYYVLPGLLYDQAPYFRTVQAAINAGAGLNVLIELPVFTGLTENLVFPASGAYTLYCPDPHFGYTILGNLSDVASSTGRIIQLINCHVIGNITFINSGTFSSLLLFNSTVDGDISIGSNLLNIYSLESTNSRSANYATTYATYKNIAGNVSCGAMVAQNAGFTGDNKTYAYSDGTFRSCFIGGSTPTLVGLTTLLETPIRGIPTFTGSVRADAFSSGFLLSLPAAISGSLSVIDGSVSTGNVAFAANVGATTLLPAGAPAGKYQVDVTLVATALATLAANTAFNITHTDAAGSVTEAVPLDNAGVIGATFNLGTTSRASGSLVFNSTGAIVQLSITGITTPGPLAATYNATVRYLGP